MTSRDGRDDRKEESPPYSRIFVVCGKLNEDDLRPLFEKFGELEDLYMPRDRASGNGKGVAYIKYAKTSSAAAAIDELHLKKVSGNHKPLKVMVANQKHDNSVATEDKYKRLFIKVSKNETESELRDHFSEFGRVDHVRIHVDKNTQESKGFAFVQYDSFLGAAKGYEECNRKYRPIFATPKEDFQRSRNSLDGSMDGSNNSFNYPHYPQQGFPQNQFPHISSLMHAQPDGYTTVHVTCSPQVPQRYIEQLFNIIPGMQQMQYTNQTFDGYCKALITYADEAAAAYAVDRMNGYEFPSGELITVKPEKDQLKRVANDLTNMVDNFKKSLDGGGPDLVQLAEAIAQASTLIKHATTMQVENGNQQNNRNDFWSSLPPPKPMLSFNAKTAKRCFIIFKPSPPPPQALKDIFCRFGDLIDVSVLPHKNYGYAKYASVASADEAIRCLHMTTVNGVLLKVLEADSKPRDDDGEVGRKRSRRDDD